MMFGSSIGSLGLIFGSFGKLDVDSPVIDVTSPADIANAVATITQGGRGLYGIVNNAGVLVVAPFIEADDKDLDYIFGVKLYGPYRITKAFAPLLIQSKGRVINISSLNGIVASLLVLAVRKPRHFARRPASVTAGFRHTRFHQCRTR